MIARSFRESNAITEKVSNFSPDANSTPACRSSAMTCKLVAILPSAEIMNPVPTRSRLSVVPASLALFGKDHKVLWFAP
jgi:hypothetical protein